jgi:hypothetical protein
MISLSKYISLRSQGLQKLIKTLVTRGVDGITTLAGSRLMVVIETPDGFPGTQALSHIFIFTDLIAIRHLNFENAFAHPIH